MTSRQVVGLVLALAALALLAGVPWRLSEPGEEDAQGAGAATDSAREALGARAGSHALASDVAVRVEGAPVRRDTFVLWVEAEGEASVVRAATFRAAVAGPVLEVAAERGQPVRRGELLVRIDPAPYALDVREARAELERARADFRSRVLHDEAIADDSLRAERRRQARIRTGVAAAEVALERAEARRAETEVRAPFAGRVADLAVAEGTRVRQGDSLVSVLDFRRVEVEVDVLETILAVVTPGRRATARFAAFPDRSFHGRVVSVNPRVDPGTNTARVRVRLAKPGTRVVPGMHADVRIAGHLHEDRTFVPREAIVERDRREVVFLFDPRGEGSREGRARWRYVNTGLESDRYVEIAPPETGAQASPEELRGRIVLVAGHATLAHGAAVRLVEDPGRGGGGSP